MNPDFNADNEPYNLFDEPKQTKTFLDQKTSWMETPGLFGKSLVSNDGLLGHTGERKSC